MIQNTNNTSEQDKLRLLRMVLHSVKNLDTNNDGIVTEAEWNKGYNHAYQIDNDDIPVRGEVYA